MNAREIKDKVVEKAGEVKDKTKAHVQEHKAFYIGAGSGVALAAAFVAGAYIGKADVKVDPKIQQILSYKPLAIQKTVVELTERANLSKPCKIKGSNKLEDIFLSQNDFARQYGVPQSVVSEHLNGKRPDVDGIVLEWIQKSTEASQN
jgi:uncharacterized membrane protein